MQTLVICVRKNCVFFRGITYQCINVVQFLYMNFTIPQNTAHFCPPSQVAPLYDLDLLNYLTQGKLQHSMQHRRSRKTAFSSLVLHFFLANKPMSWMNQGMVQWAWGKCQVQPCTYPCQQQMKLLGTIFKNPSRNSSVALHIPYLKMPTWHSDATMDL